jgi:hypothetical protein
MAGSLEFATYAKMISDKLGRSGYSPCDCVASNADLIVFVLYGIDNGRTVLRSAPVYGWTGGGQTYYSGVVGGYSYSGSSYSQPQFGVVGSQQYSQVQFTRFLQVSMADGADMRTGKVTWKYEGRVTSTGISGNVSQIVPVMIDALFQNFPGVSGKTRRVSLPLP